MIELTPLDFRHCYVFEVVVFWVVAPCSLVVGNRRFGCRAISVFRVKVRDQGDISTASVRACRGSWCVISGFYCGEMEPRITHCYVLLIGWIAETGGSKFGSWRTAVGNAAWLLSRPVFKLSLCSFKADITTNLGKHKINIRLNCMNCVQWDNSCTYSTLGTNWNLWFHFEFSFIINNNFYLFLDRVQFTDRNNL